MTSLSQLVSAQGRRRHSTASPPWRTLRRCPIHGLPIFLALQWQLAPPGTLAAPSGARPSARTTAFRRLRVPRRALATSSGTGCSRCSRDCGRRLGREQEYQCHAAAGTSSARYCPRSATFCDKQGLSNTPMGSPRRRDIDTLVPSREAAVKSAMQIAGWSESRRHSIVKYARDTLLSL